jgi:poly-gamma-glutamate synthesis protein (capsule biosynthesis protein)
MTNSAHGDEGIRLTFVGDFAFMKEYLIPPKDNRDPEYYFGDVRGFFEGADVAFVNLESPLFNVGRPARRKTSPKLYSPHEKMIPVLEYLGIDVVCLANNHIDDFGTESLIETKRILVDNGLEVFGVGTDQQESRRPLIISRQGKRIGFLGYTATEIGCGFSAADAAGTNVYDFADIADDIAAIREGVDVIVVSLHWGLEFARYPSPHQIGLAHRIIDCGADIIVGHHPHCVQGMERYKQGLIFYSLGNFFLVNSLKRLGYTEYGNEFLIATCVVGTDGIKTELVPGWMGIDNRLRVLDDRREFDERFRRYSDTINSPDYAAFWEEHRRQVKLHRKEVHRRHSILSIRSFSDITNILYKIRTYGLRHMVGRLIARARGK